MLEGSSPRDSGASSAQDPGPLRQRLQALWEAKDTEKLKEEIQQIYTTLEDPLGWLLEVLEGSEEWKGKGHSLATCLVKELQNWLRTHPRGQLSGLRLKKVHARVFPILAQCHGNLLDPLIVIYQLHAADRHYLLGQVEHLYHRKKYKEAAILGVKFHLQPDLNLEEMCVPLLLQEKIDLVEAYVEGYPVLQEQLLRVLDAWFDPGFQIKDVIRECQGLSGLRPEKFNHRLLNKTVFRFLDRYGLDPALCPNVVNQRHLGTLKYLLHKRFVEKTMTHENWMDHVQSTVGKNPWLQEKLVRLLVRHGGLGVAAWWARHYGLPRERLPYGLMEEMEKLKLQEREEDPPELMANAVETRRRDDCYQLPIPRDRVLFVSTWAELPQVEKAVLQPGQVVGIDMEWRPSFGTVGGKPRISLVQLAVQGWVFLLDVLQLLGNGREEEEESLARFFRDLFANPTVTKIGYGMTGDLHGLRGTSAAFLDVDKQMCSFLDLLAVQKQLPKCSKEAKKAFRDGEADVFPTAEGCKRVHPLPAERGLSLLVHEVLGRPLDKTEQLSNWEKRPLRESQVLYAASDAYCLLEVHATLLKDPAAFGLNPNLAPPLAGKAHAGAEAKKPTSEQGASDPRTEISGHAPGEVPAASASVSVEDFRVVCDNMLQGLGRYLRCLGVDVQILENEDEHRKAAEIARQEGRVILTSGLPYHTLQSQVGEGRCFHVDSSEKAKDQALQVLKHFGVRVSLADVFSRCQSNKEVGGLPGNSHRDRRGEACNCNRYLKIPKEKMAHLVKERARLKEERSTSGDLPSKDPGSSIERAALAWDPQGPSDDPSGRRLPDPSLAGEPGLLPSGIPLKIEGIPTGVLQKESLDCFYVCSRCGKVFWEGSHFGRVVSQFQEVLDLSEGSPSVYEQV